MKIRMDSVDKQVWNIMTPVAHRTGGDRLKSKRQMDISQISTSAERERERERIRTHRRTHAASLTDAASKTRLSLDVGIGRRRRVVAARVV